MPFEWGEKQRIFFETLDSDLSLRSNLLPAKLYNGFSFIQTIDRCLELNQTTAEFEYGVKILLSHAWEYSLFLVLDARGTDALHEDFDVQTLGLKEIFEGLRLKGCFYFIHGDAQLICNLL